MFDSMQVLIGDGPRDKGVLHRAIVVAAQLHAASRWDGRGRIVIHHPREVHRRLQFSPRERYDAATNVNVHAAVHELEAGQDFEIRILSLSDCHRLGIPELAVLSKCETCNGAGRVRVFDSEHQVSCPVCGGYSVE
jgi:DnaJ-class molecular chaperone